MNLFLLGICIFVIVYLFLNWFARTSSKKIVTHIKKFTVYLSLILATILTIGGKYIFSLPFLFVILSGLKIKGLSALQVLQLWRLIQYLKNSGRFSQGNFGQAQGSSNISIDEEGNLIVKLAIEKTDCKAKELCGVPETIEKSTSNLESSCAPGGGCC